MLNVDINVNLKIHCSDMNFFLREKLSLCNRNHNILALWCPKKCSNRIINNEKKESWFSYSKFVIKSNVLLFLKCVYMKCTYFKKWILVTADCQLILFLQFFAVLVTPLYRRNESNWVYYNSTIYRSTIVCICVK